MLRSVGQADGWNDLLTDEEQFANPQEEKPAAHVSGEGARWGGEAGASLGV